MAPLLKLSGSYNGALNLEVQTYPSSLASAAKGKAQQFRTRASHTLVICLQLHSFYVVVWFFPTSITFLIVTAYLLLSYCHLKDYDNTWSLICFLGSSVVCGLLATNLRFWFWACIRGEKLSRLPTREKRVGSGFILIEVIKAGSPHPLNTSLQVAWTVRPVPPVLTLKGPAWSFPLSVGERLFPPG